ncbi:fimbrial protein (plasmid) [Serratia sp. JSRIV001]|uniref:fimbrial protein n=1 Tax=unclassified Serratia (in: enterobacteria) TaxID=2647522 RepID=UPI001CBCDF6F|nr:MULTISPECIES: fimbrial protein [unclassified Serratia (in: enterobacteria)]UAN45222.1 fimbrial protein [Serratia sp. JSRIV001]UAN48824.1 fimbrial protein [Serratia sp. JSRIV001]UAN50696.1 fimbrial protein [Serratia sp. JSRIV002]UAN54544.1 fimbrial protein [Serratia sp. JSRIV002]UAN56643.1 fimbrial protein [Serratia sp. JSRIV004]
MSRARHGHKQGQEARRSLLMGALVLAVAMPSAMAAPLDVNIRGVVVSVPCQINNNTDISVNLGNDLLTTRIPASNSISTGNTYETEIPYTLDCTVAAGAGQQVRMQLYGTSAGFDNGVLMTSNTNLGLELRQNGTRVSPNQWFNLTSAAATPKLTVVPVKNSGTTLSGGAFRATLTLKVDFQ